MIARALLALGVLATAMPVAGAAAQTTQPAPVSSALGHARPKPATRHTATHATAHTATHTAAHAVAPARHVPVVVARHKPPARAVAAAKKVAVVHKEPPPAPKVEAARKPAPPPVPADVGTNTGLHLPRYASLKSDDVNMRVGPAERYPVIWTYKRRELPVRIEREFDIWRLVEDMDGVKGWVHQATLTGRRTFVITGTEDRTVRADASVTAGPVAVLKPGVVGRIKACEAGKAWCQVQVGDYRGWLQRSEMWGVDADEAVAP